MKPMPPAPRFAITAFFVAGALALGGRAQADTIVLEAEGPEISDYDYRITSPLLIKNDANASKSRYVEVQAGYESKTSPPSAEGVSSQKFDVTSSGTYRIWGRVIAPNDGDDSFWIRVDGGTPVKWNPIEPGSSWHWDIVKHDGGSSPSTFSLTPGTHYLEVSYREDGAKLDVLVITSDTAFNPDSPPTTVPTGDIPGISFPKMLAVGSRGSTIKLTWSAVPGAVSYTVRRQTGEDPLTVWQTGVTELKVSEASPSDPFESICYDVLAIFADNSYRVPPQGVCAQGHVTHTFLGLGRFNTTSPMYLLEDNEVGTQSGTSESLNSVPAHGRARFDFMTGGSSQVRLWFRPYGPNVDNDSFWVRMDDGAWFKWNGFGTSGACVPVGDFYNNPVTFSVAAGSHTFEVAYREVGAKLTTHFFVTDDLTATAGMCDD